MNRETELILCLYAMTTIRSRFSMIRDPELDKMLWKYQWECLEPAVKHILLENYREILGAK